MKIRRRGLSENLSVRLFSSFLAFVLVLGMILMTPGLDGEAQAVDFTQNCSLTVMPGSDELAADLANAHVVVDLYKVADPVGVDGYDAYDFKFREGFRELETAYSKNPTNADWKKMAQEAAGYALDNKREPVRTGNVNESIDGLGWGLYLVIARGNDIEGGDYRTTIKQEDGTEAIATLAHSERYVYTYEPELIALPSKQAVGEDGTVVNTTAGNDAWEMNMRITLKPSQELRYGSLEIVKTLQSYNYNAGAENREPAEFVFQVEAELNGEKVRSTVVSLSFAQAGQKSVIVDQIPIGAVATVTEVYSGTVYQVVTDPVQTSEPIEAVDVVSVEFANDYNETNRGGGAVTNHFTYNEEADQWKWEQVPDNSVNGE